MKKIFNRGEIYFSLLLAFFLSWYNVLNLIYMSDASWLSIMRLLVSFAFIFVMLEVMFVLIGLVRKKPLVGNNKLQFFHWRKVLPIAMFISGAGTIFYFITLPGLTIPLAIGLACGFVLGTLLTMLYFYGLVEKK